LNRLNTFRKTLSDDRAAYPDSFRKPEIDLWIGRPIGALRGVLSPVPITSAPSTDPERRRDRDRGPTFNRLTPGLFQKCVTLPRVTGCRQANLDGR
jgi:hypothetical protein